MRKLAFFAVFIVLGFLSMGCNVSSEARFRVNYQGNGNTYGYAHEDKNQYRYGDYAEVLDENTLLKTGYTFRRWNTRADGSGESHEAGASIRIGGPVFLYAVWERN